MLINIQRIQRNSNVVNTYQVRCKRLGLYKVIKNNSTILFYKFKKILRSFAKHRKFVNNRGFKVMREKEVGKDRQRRAGLNGNVWRISCVDSAQIYAAAAAANEAASPALAEYCDIKLVKLAHPGLKILLTVR